MAARLTDKQKKMIIADYVEMGSYNSVAKKWGISDKTVRSIVLKNPESKEKSELKKEQNTLDMIAYMDSKRDTAQGLLCSMLEEMMKPEKLAKASLVQIATAFGIVADKFTKNTHSGGDSLDKLDGLLKEFRDAVK